MSVTPFPNRKTLVQPVIEIHPPPAFGHGRYTVIVWTNPFREDGMSGEVATLAEAKRLAADLRAIVQGGLGK